MFAQHVLFLGPSVNFPFVVLNNLVKKGILVIKSVWLPILFIIFLFILFMFKYVISDRCIDVGDKYYRNSFIISYNI